MNSSARRPKSTVGYPPTPALALTQWLIPLLRTPDSSPHGHLQSRLPVQVRPGGAGAAAGVEHFWLACWGCRAGVGAPSGWGRVGSSSGASAVEGSGWQSYRPNSANTRDRPLREACERATVDWAALDPDGDGRSKPDDAVVVLIGPRGNAAGADRLVDPFVVCGDCTKPSDSERGDAAMNFSRAGSNLSVQCHEFGHALFGLHDRYGESDRVARYDRMSDSNDLKFLNPLDRMRTDGSNQDCCT